MNIVHLRGTVFSDPKHDMVKGVERLQFVLACRSETPVPSVIVDYDDTFKCNIQVRAYENKAVECWNNLYRGAYIKDLYGHIMTYSYGHYSVHINGIDLSEIGSESEEYPAQNEVRLSGYMANDGWLNHYDLEGKLSDHLLPPSEIGAVEKKFMLAAVPDLRAKKRGEGDDCVAFPRIKCFGELAEEVNRHGKGDRINYLRGMIFTWYCKNGRRRREYAILAEEIRWEGKKVKKT